MQIEVLSKLTQKPILVKVFWGEYASKNIVGVQQWNTVCEEFSFIDDAIWDIDVVAQNDEEPMLSIAGEVLEFLMSHYDGIEPEVANRIIGILTVD